MQYLQVNSRARCQPSPFSCPIEPHPVPGKKVFIPPTPPIVLDAMGMVSMLADVKDFPDSYVVITDMPGLKLDDIKILVEDDNVLVITGERKKEEDNQGPKPKHIIMERMAGKFIRKFVLPENAKKDAIFAVFQDGVLTVTLYKLTLNQSKQPKTIEVKIA